MTHRVIMLGVDGLDWELVKGWSSKGHLPTLRGLLEQSRALLLGESNRPLPGSVWTDIATGVSAAVHGFQHEEQLRLGTYQIQKMDSRCVSSPPFYKTLSDANIRCAVVDFPIDHPIDGFNGMQVVDWASEFKLWHFETRPTALAAQLEAKYGQHPLTHYPGTRVGLDNLLALKHKLLRGIDIKRKLCADLIRQHTHDFIFVNFCELHKAGHFFWQFHDHNHPEFTAAEPQLVDSLRESYEYMDQALGSLLRQLGDDDDLILITDRGMYADHRGDHLVDDLLVALGLAERRGEPKASSATGSLRNRLLTGHRAGKLFRSVARRLPDNVREALLPIHRAAIGAQPPWDWARTRVFRLPSVGNSYLRVNLAGREPAGFVMPGDQYNALLSLLETQFRSLVDPVTGEKVVEDVYFPADHFAGPKSNELPDVAIVWNPKRPINAVSSECGTISGQQKSDRSGNHRPEGFALFRGPSFAIGAGTVQGDARQIAPTILKLFGIRAPGHYEMDAPRSIWTDSFAELEFTKPAERRLPGVYAPQTL